MLIDQIAHFNPCIESRFTNTTFVFICSRINGDMGRFQFHAMKNDITVNIFVLISLGNGVDLFLRTKQPC